MLTATKIRLYPNADQEQHLAVQFGCARFVWNRALAIKRAAWQERKESLSCYTIKGMLPVWKAGEFPSTKTCSCCGAIHEGLTLSDRTWLCAACGTLHDRDENAAENIRRQGILKLKAEGLSVSAHGGGVSRVLSAPATAVEVGSLRLLA